VGGVPDARARTQRPSRGSPAPSPQLSRLRARNAPHRGMRDVVEACQGLLRDQVGVRSALGKERQQGALLRDQVRTLNARLALLSEAAEVSG